MNHNTTTSPPARPVTRRARLTTAIAATGLVTAALGGHAGAVLDGEHDHDVGSDLLSGFCGLDMMSSWDVAGS
jgi:hypothetical protein